MGGRGGPWEDVSVHGWGRSVHGRNSPVSGVQQMALRQGSRLTRSTGLVRPSATIWLAVIHWTSTSFSAIGAKAHHYCGWQGNRPIVRSRGRRSVVERLKNVRGFALGKTAIGSNVQHSHGDKKYHLIAGNHVKRWITVHRLEADSGRDVIADETVLGPILPKRSGWWTRRSCGRNSIGTNTTQAGIKMAKRYGRALVHRQYLLQIARATAHRLERETASSNAVPPNRPILERQPAPPGRGGGPMTTADERRGCRYSGIARVSPPSAPAARTHCSIASGFDGDVVDTDSDEMQSHIANFMRANSRAGDSTAIRCLCGDLRSL